MDFCKRAVSVALIAGFLSKHVVVNHIGVWGLKMFRKAIVFNLILGAAVILFAVGWIYLKHSNLPEKYFAVNGMRMDRVSDSRFEIRVVDNYDFRLQSFETNFKKQELSDTLYVWQCGDRIFLDTMKLDNHEHEIDLIVLNSQH